MKLSGDKIDALKEILNIGSGQAAGALNDLVGSFVHMDVSNVEVLSYKDMNERFPEYSKDHFSVTMEFKGNFTGKSAMLFTEESVLTLVKATSDIDPDHSEIETFKTGTMFEIGNIVLNSMMGSIANMFNEHLTFELPAVNAASISDLFNVDKGQACEIMLAQSQLTIAELNVRNDIMICFDLKSYTHLFEFIAQMIVTNMMDNH